MIIEPGRLPLPLLYEAAARGGASVLAEADCNMVRTRVAWSCRSLQTALRELADACNGQHAMSNNGVAGRACRAVVDAQEQIGSHVQDYLEHLPDWLDDIAEDTWRQIGGW